MKYSASLLALASLVAAAPKAIPDSIAGTDSDGLKHGSAYSNSMGPASIMYPFTRQWTADNDNIAPCGSTAGVGNRSDFPLDDGFVALVAKYISTRIQISISYKNNPTTQDDFQEWYNGNVSDEIHIGHSCFYMPDQPSSIAAGDNATIQMIYENDDEDNLGEDGAPTEASTNQTFYACADITFVEESVFEVSDYAMMCFNATNDNYYDVASTTASSARSSSSAASSTAGSSSSSSATASAAASSTSAGAANALLSNPVVGVLGALAVAVNFI